MVAFSFFFRFVLFMVGRRTVVDGFVVLWFCVFGGFWGLCRWSGCRSRRGGNRGGMNGRVEEKEELNRKKS